MISGSYGFQFDPRDFKHFQQNVKFINAEWGVEIPLINDEQMFKQLQQANASKIYKPVITFRDISALLTQKFHLKGEDKKMIRFLDAENLKIIMKSDHVIFERGCSKRNFIVQIGKQDIVKLEDLGINDLESTIGNRIKDICNSLEQYVYYDTELANYVSEEEFNSMKD